MLNQPGSYGGVMQPTAPVPEDLDWEMFQGPAPRKPFSPSYLRWRAFYMYGGGLMTDWGVHLTDIALLAMKADGKAPILTSGSSQYVGFPKDLEQFPDVFTAAWQYDDFLMTFTNIQPPSSGSSRLNGNYFYGTRGVLHVNRSGYRILPQPQRGRDAATGRWRGAGARAAGLGPRGSGRAAGAAARPIEAKMYRQDEAYEDDPHTKAHARNFLDCVKSRKSPVADITTRVLRHASVPARTPGRQGRQRVPLGRQEGGSGLDRRQKTEDQEPEAPGFWHSAGETDELLARDGRCWPALRPGWLRVRDHSSARRPDGRPVRPGLPARGLPRPPQFDDHRPGGRRSPSRRA